MTFVITYDNGSGYREWAASPRPTEAEAWEVAGLEPGGQVFAGSDTKCERVGMSQEELVQLRDLLAVARSLMPKAEAIYVAEADEGGAPLHLEGHWLEEGYGYNHAHHYKVRGPEFRLEDNVTVTW